MKKDISVILVIVVLQISLLSCSKSTNTNNKSEKITQEEKTGLNKNIYDIKVKTMEGQEKSLSDYKGKVLLIVNVASKCGYTKQYSGLEEIYLKYKDQGFEILAFPCNDFGGQEPGTNEEIAAFCSGNFNVTFPLFDKISVMGEDQSPLYERLTLNSDPAGDIDWNFEKFLIDKNGDIAVRYKSKVKPESEELTGKIETLLN
jgi:glutathione peroxidase